MSKYKTSSGLLEFLESDNVVKYDVSSAVESFSYIEFDLSFHKIDLDSKKIIVL